MAEIPDSASERISTKSAWINRIISAGLGIGVTVAAALIITRIEAREPRLTYTSTESVPFNGPSGEVSIYQVTFSNDGKREIDDVACAIRVPSAHIDQYKITVDPLIHPKATLVGDSMDVEVPNLNPSESVQVSVLASGPQSLPARPEVSLRGRGTTGTEKTQSGVSFTQELPTVSLIASVLAMLVSGVFTSVLRRSRRSGLLSGLGDDQRHVLAYVCRANGLGDLANQYLSQPHETTYWAEADRLGQIALDSEDKRRAEAIEQTLSALLEYGDRIAKSSRAIVLYNLALISRAKHDETLYEKYLGMARDISAEEIGWRVKIDRRLSPNSP